MRAARPSRSDQRARHQSRLSAAGAVEPSDSIAPTAEPLGVATKPWLRRNTPSGAPFFQRTHRSTSSHRKICFLLHSALVDLIATYSTSLPFLFDVPINGDSDNGNALACDVVNVNLPLLRAIDVLLEEIRMKPSLVTGFILVLIKLFLTAAQRTRRPSSFVERS
jgi:hypothetical protein